MLTLLCNVSLLSSVHCSATIIYKKEGKKKQIKENKYICTIKTPPPPLFFALPLDLLYIHWQIEKSDILEVGTGWTNSRVVRRGH